MRALTFLRSVFLAFALFAVTSYGVADPQLLGTWVVGSSVSLSTMPLGSVSDLKKLVFVDPVLYQVMSSTQTPCNYRLGFQNGVKTIDVYDAAGHVALGIYSINGNTLTLAYGRAGTRPRDFTMNQNNAIVAITANREGTAAASVRTTITVHVGPWNGSSSPGVSVTPSTTVPTITVRVMPARPSPGTSRPAPSSTTPTYPLATPPSTSAKTPTVPIPKVAPAKPPVTPVTPRVSPAVPPVDRFKAAPKPPSVSAKPAKPTGPVVVPPEPVVPDAAPQTTSDGMGPLD